MNRRLLLLIAPLLLASAALAQKNEPQGRVEINAPTFPSTYTCGVSNITAAATPTDVMTITPGSGKVLRVFWVEAYLTQTTAAPETVNYIRRSSADSGGTFVQDGINPADTIDGASTSTCGHYTANPAGLGTAAATLGNYRPLIPTATTIPTGYLGTPFGDLGTKPLVFRGANDIFAYSFGGQTIAGLNFHIQIWFTEAAQ